MKKNAIIYFTIFISINVILSIFIISTGMADPVDTDYYISNDGDDSNSGTSPAQAWKTIAKLNNAFGDGTISQGDDIYFNRGDTWAENLGTGVDSGLDIEKGGTASNWMIIGAYGTGADPILENTNSGGGRTAGTSASTISCDDTIGYIRIENIDIESVDDNSYAEILMTTTADQNNIVIHNVDIDGGQNGIFIFRVDTFTIENCDISGVTEGGIYVYGQNTGVQPCNGIIRNCTIVSGDNAIGFHRTDSGAKRHIGNNFWIENCIIHGQTDDQGLDIVSGGHILIENCEIYDSFAFVLNHEVHDVTVQNCFIHDQSRDAFYVVDPDNVIIRNNVVKDITGGKDAFVHDDCTWDSLWVHITVYNNDFLNCDDWYTVVANADVSECFVKNNIFSRSSGTGNNIYTSFISPATPANTNHEFTYNCWWRPDGLLNDHWSWGGANHNWAQWIALDEVQNEIRDNPELYNINGDNYPNDFELLSTSPCIDAGDWLTKTNGGGSGKTITVDEANYFYPGISALGLPGDNIFVGDDTDLEITAVNYDSNTITVDRSITWADGDDVSLSSYSGTAPDIGAFESTFSQPEENTIEISNVVLTESEPLDTDPNFGWINIASDVIADAGVSTVKLNITYPDSSTTSVTMNTDGSDNYYYTTSTIFSDYGNYDYHIWAVDTDGVQDISSVYDFSMPPNWDVDEDGVCNVLDLMLISNHYDETGSNGWIREDVDNNGVISVLDLVEVSAHYLETWQ